MTTVIKKTEVNLKSLLMKVMFVAAIISAIIPVLKKSPNWK